MKTTRYFFGLLMIVFLLTSCGTSQTDNNKTNTVNEKQTKSTDLPNGNKENKNEITTEKNKISTPNNEVVKTSIPIKKKLSLDDVEIDQNENSTVIALDVKINTTQHKIDSINALLKK